jgi:DNA mismatch endonuclease (patch repair protein)
MADCFVDSFRSKVMRAVKSQGNKSTELRLIEIFKMFGLTGWRRRQKIEGRPDFVFRKNKLAVFTDGCFWHGHGCRNTQPKTNAAYWQAKIANNRNRDRCVNKILRKKGWKVVRFWECEITKNKYSGKIRRLLSVVNV